MLRKARRRSREKGMECNITRDDITIPDFCPVLGIPLARTAVKVSHGSPSLDRIDNSKGYVRGNVRVISYRANILKSNATVDELERVLGDLKFSQGR